MSAVFEGYLPLPEGFGSRGGPVWQTDVLALASGREVRNQRQLAARRRYELAGPIQTDAALSALLAFFEARRGRMEGFLYRDPLDQASGTPPGATDEVLGIGDGTARRFGLVKRYGAVSERQITRPVEGSVRVSTGGTEIMGFSVLPGGVVELETPPGPGVEVRAEFGFDVPVRFDTDVLEIEREGFGAARIVRLPLIEILEGDAA